MTSAHPAFVAHHPAQRSPRQCAVRHDCCSPCTPLVVPRAHERARVDRRRAPPLVTPRIVVAGHTQNMGRRRPKFNPGAFDSILSGVKTIYRDKVRPLEEQYMIKDFHYPLLTDDDFDAKPMILLIGSYSVGKSSFIKYLLERVRPPLPQRHAAARRPHASRAPTARSPRTHRSPRRMPPSSKAPPCQRRTTRAFTSALSRRPTISKRSCTDRRSVRCLGTRWSRAAPRPSAASPSLATTSSHASVAARCPRSLQRGVRLSVRCPTELSPPQPWPWPGPALPQP